MMRYWVAAGLIIGSSTGVGAGQEIPVSIRSCSSFDAVIFDRVSDAINGEVLVGTNVIRGITDRVGPGPFPEKMSHDCRVVFTAAGTRIDFSNRCVYVDAEGDKIISEASGNQHSFQWKWVAGTGKFEGVTGNGTATTDALYPRVNAAVGSGCWTGKGSYSLK